MSNTIWIFAFATIAILAYVSWKTYEGYQGAIITKSIYINRASTGTVTIKYVEPGLLKAAPTKAANTLIVGEFDAALPTNLKAIRFAYWVDAQRKFVELTPDQVKRVVDAENSQAIRFEIKHTDKAKNRLKKPLPPPATGAPPPPTPLPNEVRMPEDKSKIKSITIPNLQTSTFGVLSATGAQATGATIPWSGANIQIMFDFSA